MLVCPFLNGKLGGETWRGKLGEVILYRYRRATESRTGRLLLGGILLLIYSNIYFVLHEPCGWVAAGNHSRCTWYIASM